jgi:hypothetical protein
VPGSYIALQHSLLTLLLLSLSLSLCCCLQLSAAVQEAKASSILATGGVDLWAVGSHLRSKHGYLIALRRANVVQRPKAYLRQLRHDFLVVRGLQPTSEGAAPPPEVLVDLNFRDHFKVAHATPWYTKLLAALPQVSPFRTCSRWGSFLELPAVVASRYGVPSQRSRLLSPCNSSVLFCSLPQDWVGSAQALAPLVGLMSAGEEEGLPGA